jgi:hypothetical protein
VALAAHQSGQAERPLGRGPPRSGVERPLVRVPPRSRVPCAHVTPVPARTSEPFNALTPQVCATTPTRPGITPRRCSTDSLGKTIPATVQHCAERPVSAPWHCAANHCTTNTWSPRTGVAEPSKGDGHFFHVYTGLHRDVRPAGTVFSVAICPAAILATATPLRARQHHPRRR